MGKGYSPTSYLIERFDKFLSNAWVHMAQKVSSLEAKMHLVLALLTTLVGLMVYVGIR